MKKIMTFLKRHYFNIFLIILGLMGIIFVIIESMDEDTSTSQLIIGCILFPMNLLDGIYNIKNNKSINDVFKEDENKNGDDEK